MSKEKNKDKKIKDNLSLWAKVEKTNPIYTKEVTYGRKFTAIDAYSQFQKATEMFGVFGIDWKVVDEKFDIIMDKLLVYSGKLIFNYNEKTGEIYLHSAIELVSAKGRIDSDAYKKVATDSLTKALSKLGFNADIFLGKFEDNKYVDALNKSFNKLATAEDWAEITNLLIGKEKATAKEDRTKILKYITQKGLDVHTLKHDEATKIIEELKK